MIDIEQRVLDHDNRLLLMEDQRTRDSEQMTALLGELRGLSGELRETVVTFKEYTVKHDNLRESNIKLWQKYEKQNEEIAKIKEKNASNQEVINSVVSIKNKVMVIVIGAILSPITIGAAILFSK